MQSILKSLRDFFRGTRLIYKISWIIAIFIIPIAVLTWMLVATIRDERIFTEREVLGVEYFQAVRQLTEAEIDYRRAANDFTSFPALTDFDTLRNAQNRVQTAVTAIENAEKLLGDNPHTKGAYEKLKWTWALSKSLLGSGFNSATERARLQGATALDRDQLAALESVIRECEEIESRANTTNAQKKQRQLLVVNNQLLESTIELMTEVADTSNLTLDPRMETYVLQAWLIRTAQAAHLSSQAQLVGLQLLGKPTAPQEWRNEFLILKGKLDLVRGEFYSGWEDFIKERPEVARTMEPLYERQVSSMSEFLSTLETRVIMAEVVNERRDVLLREGSEAVTASFNLFDTAEVALKTLLNERIGAFQSKINLSITTVVIGLSLVLVVSALIAGRISRQTRELTSTFEQIAIGNYQTRAAVVANDETGFVASELNTMLDKTLQLIQSREERDTIQTSIMKLLEEVSGVADGDLTREVEVTADITGAIADSFNYLISQLRTVIGEVQRTTNRVREYAGDIYNSTHALSEHSESQSRQIIDTSARVDQMTASIQDVSRSASLSANVADQALSSAREGNAAVRNTIQGMDRIRDQVQETAKRIKRLGESSQEIGQIVQLIDDIADRTSILALNASIQAAMAGEAGRGFAVVAEEVERLADRSTEATKKISNLVKSIQSETNEAVGAMEKGIQEVIEGSRLATQAGSALNEIESVSQKLAGLIQTISTSSKQQAVASESVSKSMAEISQVTLNTAQGTKLAANEVNSLATLAEKLRTSVISFRLPGGSPTADLKIESTSRKIEVKPVTMANGNGKSHF